MTPIPSELALQTVSTMTSPLPGSVLPELLLATILFSDLSTVSVISHPAPYLSDDVRWGVCAPLAFRVITLRVFAVQGASRSLDYCPGAAEFWLHLRSAPKMSGLASTTLKSTKYRLPSSDSFFWPENRPITWICGRGSRLSDSSFFWADA